MFLNDSESAEVADLLQWCSSCKGYKPPGQQLAAGAVLNCFAGLRRVFFPGHALITAPPVAGAFLGRPRALGCPRAHTPLHRLHEMAPVPVWIITAHGRTRAWVDISKREGSFSRDAPFTGCLDRNGL